MAQPTTLKIRASIPQDLRDEVESVIFDADRWLETPNRQLGGAVPRDLIGTPSEPVLRNLIQMIKAGMFT